MPAAVNGVADVNATLLPVVASIQLTPTPPLVNGQAGSTTLIFTAFDAGGNPLSAGLPFSTPLQLTAASSAITFSPSTITSPTTAVTITYTGAPITNTQVVAQAGPATFTAQLPISNMSGTPTPTPPPTPPPTPTPPPQSVVLGINPDDIGVTVGGPGVPLTVSLSGASGPVLLVATCNAGAQISLSQSSVPAGNTNVTVTAVAPPSSAVVHACTVTGTVGSLTVSAFVDVNQNTVTVNAHGRRAR